MEAALSTPAMTAVTRGRVGSSARWSLSLILAWSAGGKLFWPTEFRALLDGLGMLPASLVGLVQYGLAPAELTLSVLFALGAWQAPAALVALFFSLVFAAVHVFAIVSGTAAPCGCAGVLISQAYRESHILFLLVAIMMAGCSLTLLLHRGPPAGDGPDADQASLSP